jgi:putative transposase
MLIHTTDELPLRKVCTLLNLPRSSFYYNGVGLSQENTDLMNEIHNIWMAHPFYGYRKINVALREHGYLVNEKRTLRLMRTMGLQAIYQKPKLSANNMLTKVKYPYLLNDIVINAPNKVWATDITYLRMQHGFMYLIAILDWYSRYIVAWELSNTLTADFCITALEKALSITIPEIFNTDHGVQFTSNKWLDILIAHNVQISMTGKGRCIDNIYPERLWRTIKYEDFYLHCYEDGFALQEGLEKFIQFYNERRYHQALQYKTPKQVYFN